MRHLGTAGSAHYVCPRLPGPIPDIFAASVIDVNEERLVSTDSTVRRRILRKYKWDVVRPAVLHLD